MTATVAPSMMQIDDIVVEGRSRSDLGDLAALQESIRTVGLLHPVVVDQAGHLIAGQRRLAACRAIGWNEIPVTIAADLYDARLALIAERDENVCRRDMAPSEKVALGLKLEELERPKAAERKAANLALSPNHDGRENFSSPSRGTRTGKVLDLVGEAVGMSGVTYHRAKAVVAAAESGDPVAIEAREQMDRTGKVTPAYEKLPGVKPTYRPRTAESAPDPSPDENGRYASGRSVQRIAGQAAALALALDAIPIAKSCARLTETEQQKALADCKQGLKALNVLAKALGR